MIPTLLLHPTTVSLARTAGMIVFGTAVATASQLVAMRVVKALSPAPVPAPAPAAAAPPRPSAPPSPVQVADTISRLQLGVVTAAMRPGETFFEALERPAVRAAAIAIMTAIDPVPAPQPATAPTPANEPAGAFQAFGQPEAA